jgi:hypothetical protein
MGMIFVANAERAPSDNRSYARTHYPKPEVFVPGAVKIELRMTNHIRKPEIVVSGTHAEWTHWIAQEIVESNTAQSVTDDPDYVMFYVESKPNIDATIYARWIQSWIEVQWMPSLGDYLRTVVRALAEEG